MSFLNPVNEPVLRFKSTDAGAPQINYNARTAGDVKAVLKACLADGYGATASAGWTIANDVGGVIEFVSPSAAMGGYRLGIDDTTTANTTWYFTHENIRINPTFNSVPRAISEINKSSSDNGWQLLVTGLGIYFIEVVYGTSAKSKVARVTYWGQIKSALQNSAGQNMSFWNVGMGGNNDVPTRFFQNVTNASKHYHRLGDNDSGFSFFGANIELLERTVDKTQAAVNLVNAVYLKNSGVFFGECAGLLLKDVKDTTDIFGVFDTTFNSRPMLQLCISLSTSISTSPPRYSVVALLPLDYWNY